MKKTPPMMAAIATTAPTTIPATAPVLRPFDDPPLTLFACAASELAAPASEVAEAEASTTTSEVEWEVKVSGPADDSSCARRKSGEGSESVAIWVSKAYAAIAYRSGGGRGCRSGGCGGETQQRSVILPVSPLRAARRLVRTSLCAPVSSVQQPYARTWSPAQF